VLANERGIGHDERLVGGWNGSGMTRARWVLVGDGSVAFQVRGVGPNVVEVPNGAGLIWSDHPLTRAWPERVEEFARFVSYDGLGSGHSDPLLHGRVPSVEEKVNEAIAVMDAADVEDAVVVAWFAAAPIALALADAFPRRVRGIVLVNGFARLVEDADFPEGVSRESREAFEHTVADEYGSGRMVERWLPEVSHHPEVRAFMERYEQALSKRGQIAQLSRFVTALDVRDRLNSIDVPVTIIHASDDGVVPCALGVDLHARLEGSVYVEVPTSHHLFTLPPLVDVVIEQTRIMVSGDPGDVKHSSLVALVMTDIVGSTERLAALRDVAWTALLADYHQRSAEAVERFGGRRINTTGDGCIATFTSAAAALRCGAALARTAGELGIASRAGVHVGDVEALDDDIAGISVHITARLLDHASPGDVIVTDIAARAAIGAGIPNVDIGIKELRGIPGQWRLNKIDRDS
jgi:class 3 adenylate cyclase/pimeloyl-ACP methyl ester carboxylesterase